MLTNFILNHKTTRVLRSHTRKYVATFALTIAAVVAVGATSARAQSVTKLHLALGNPSAAVELRPFGASGAYGRNDDNFLIRRPQYSLSYNRYNGGPNWLAWHLVKSDTGTAGRGGFITDTTLPPFWYRVPTGDYGDTNNPQNYDRGHMCPSGDRTRTVVDNDAVFLMSNILPQAPDNNQGPWAQLETYCRTLASAGNELYIISGGRGALGAFVNGRTVIPQATWKVIVVLPDNNPNAVASLDDPALDISRITARTRVIAVDMPNVQGIRSVNWGTYRITTRDLEITTGYNFLSALPVTLQNMLEMRVDNGPTQ